MWTWQITDLPGLLILSFSWLHSTQYRQLATKPHNSPTRLGLMPHRAIMEVSTVAWQKWSMNNGYITLLQKSGAQIILSLVLVCFLKLNLEKSNSLFGYANMETWITKLHFTSKTLGWCLSTVVWITGSRTTPSLPLHQSERGCCA